MQPSECMAPAAMAGSLVCQVHKEKQSSHAGVVPHSQRPHWHQCQEVCIRGHREKNLHKIYGQKTLQHITLLHYSTTTPSRAAGRHTEKALLIEIQKERNHPQEQLRNHFDTRVLARKQGRPSARHAEPSRQRTACRGNSLLFIHPATLHLLLHAFLPYFQES